MASVLARARIVLAAAQKPDNAAALTGKGWIAGDTEALSNAINALDTADDVQDEEETHNHTGNTTDADQINKSNKRKPNSGVS